MIKYPERKLKNRKVSNKELVAFHEAGHVVMCSKFKLIYTKVSIISEDTGKIYGVVETPSMLFESEAFDIWGYKKVYPLAIIQYFAGILSEAFLSGNYDWFNAQDDMNQVEFISNRNFDCKSIEELWEISERIVIKNWGKISLIAESLIKTNELENEQVETILKTKISKINPPALLSNI